MQLATYVSSDVISSGVMSESAFNFAVNGKAFRILSDTLYQNKIGSIVREISSNAMDSHIAAGKADIPFEIHLPDKLEPWFSVTDFGVGLSHENVMNVYTTFFQSTKDNSNDQVGAFGLGSKTPFAYTDAFTVNSNYNGVCRSYSAMVREDGTPAIALFSEMPTPEGNGVTVMIPVEPQDHNKFAHEVSKQLAFFKVKPMVKNTIGEFKFADVDSAVSFALPCNFHVCSGRRDGITYIVQGGVGYPLNYSNIEHHVPCDIAIFVNSIMNNGANIYFNIGEIEVTPSREGISYSALTISNIIKKFAQAKDEYASVVMQTMNDFPTDWDRACFLNKGNSMIRSVLGNVNGKYAFSIKNNNAYFDLYDTCYIKEDVKITKDDGSVVETKVTNEIIKIQHYTLHMDKTGTMRVTSVDIEKIIAPRKGVAIVVVDDAKHALAKIRNLTRNHDTHDVVVFSSTTKNVLTDTQIHAIIAALGGVTVQRASALPLPDRKYNTNSAGYKIPKLWVLDKNSRTLPTSVRQWTAIYDSIDDLDGGYYIEVDVTTRVAHSHHAVVHNYAQLKSVDAIDLPVYAIRKKDMHKIENNSEWIKLDDALENIKKDYIEKHSKLIRKFAFNAAVRDFGCGFDSFVRDVICDNSNIISDKILKKCVRYHNKSFDIASNATFNMWITGASKYNDYVTKYKKKLNEYRDACNKKYPLLKIISVGYIYDTDVRNCAREHMLKYIQSVA